MKNYPACRVEVASIIPIKAFLCVFETSTSEHSSVIYSDVRIVGSYRHLFRPLRVDSKAFTLCWASYVGIKVDKNIVSI